MAGPVVLEANVGAVGVRNCAVSGALRCLAATLLYVPLAVAIFTVRLGITGVAKPLPHIGNYSGDNAPITKYLF
jgi:hypothetical protein